MSIMIMAPVITMAVTLWFFKSIIVNFRHPSIGFYVLVNWCKIMQEDRLPWFVIYDPDKGIKMYQSYPAQKFFMEGGGKFEKWFWKYSDLTSSSNMRAPIFETKSGLRYHCFILKTSIVWSRFFAAVVGKKLTDVSHFLSTTHVDVSISSYLSDIFQ